MSWYNVISQNSIYYPEMLHVAEISKFPGNWVVLKSFTMLFLVLSFISSVQFSRSVVSDSLRPHESHSRSSLRLRSIESVMPPSHLILCCPFSCPQSLPASVSFPMSRLFAWGGQSTGVSALASFLPKKSQGWSSEWTGWISLQCKGLSRVFSNNTVQKH